MSRSSSILRLRVFAGPNGSGKSTVIGDIREQRIAGRPMDFGYYINADDIAKDLRHQGFFFTPFGVHVAPKEFTAVAVASGLINPEFQEDSFRKSYSLRNNLIRLKSPSAAEKLAQIIADFLRKKLLAEKKKFSFETVFSHPSKLDIMRQALAEGYKVYLYFVSTESPDINKFRVAARKEKGGHDVPPDKIESRYYRSLNLLYDASQLCYQAYYFDNSVDGRKSNLFAHFKKIKDKKKWDAITSKKLTEVPLWFVEYYVRKVSLKKQGTL